MAHTCLEIAISAAGLQGPRRSEPSRRAAQLIVRRGLHPGSVQSSFGSWSFNADDELSDESYDANGNVTSASGKSFAYDSENHLISMGATVGLQYDGDGNRVAKSANGTVPLLDRTVTLARRRQPYL